MYRTSGATLECTACRSSALTPPTKLDPTEGWLHVLFWPKDSTRTTQTHKVAVDRVRVCLDCGNVMPSLGVKELSDLRDVVGTLKPIPE